MILMLLIYQETSTSSAGNSITFSKSHRLLTIFCFLRALPLRLPIFTPNQLNAAQ